MQLADVDFEQQEETGLPIRKGNDTYSQYFLHLSGLLIFFYGIALIFKFGPSEYIDQVHIAPMYSVQSHNSTLISTDIRHLTNLNGNVKLCVEFKENKDKYMTGRTTVDFIRNGQKESISKGFKLSQNSEYQYCVLDATIYNYDMLNVLAEFPLLADTQNVVVHWLVHSSLSSLIKILIEGCFAINLVSILLVHSCWASSSQVGIEKMSSIFVGAGAILFDAMETIPKLFLPAVLSLSGFALARAYMQSSVLLMFLSTFMTSMRFSGEPIPRSVVAICSILIGFVSLVINSVGLNADAHAHANPLWPGESIAMGSLVSFINKFSFFLVILITLLCLIFRNKSEGYQYWMVLVGLGIPSLVYLWSELLGSSPQNASILTIVSANLCAVISLFVHWPKKEGSFL